MIYPDSKYSQRVSIIVVNLHIDEIVHLATEEELRALSLGWKRGVVGGNNNSKVVTASR